MLQQTWQCRCLHTGSQRTQLLTLIRSGRQHCHSSVCRHVGVRVVQFGCHSDVDLPTAGRSSPHEVRSLITVRRYRYCPAPTIAVDCANASRCVDFPQWLTPIDDDVIRRPCRPPRCCCCCCAVTASDPEAEQMQQLHTTEWCLVLSESLGATFTLNDVRLKEITQSFTAIATFVNSPLHTIQPCHTSAIHAHASGSVVIADTAYLKMLTLLLLLFFF